MSMPAIPQRCGRRAISAECNTGRHLECRGCPCHSGGPGWTAVLDGDWLEAGETP